MTSIVRLTTTAAVTLALACVLACGDDGDDPGGIDAAVSIDAGAADADVDASTTNACQILCDCRTTYCAADMTACMNECAGLPASVRACRITHCGYAQAGAASTHCPHAAGDTTDVTTPAECLFDSADAGP